MPTRLPLDYQMFEDSKISITDVRDELEHVLSGKGFVKAPLLARFLRFVVEESMDGRDNQIKEYTVGLAVFDKPHNFSPQTDASVRIAAIRLRKLLEEHYQEYNPEAKLRIQLPKGTYSPLFSKNLPDTDRFYSTKKPVSQKIPVDSICVVPFSGLIHDPSIHFSVEGFSAFLSEKLSLFQEMQVKAYSSVAAFLSTGGSLEDLGAQMKVTYYLTGNIEIHRQKTDVSVHLFEAASNTLIWSHVFTSADRANTFSTIIEAIVAKIVSSIAGYSGLIHYKMFSANGVQVPPLSDAHAMAVFWFYHCQTRLSETTFRDAVQYLEKANQENPVCDLCWAVLAHLYALSILYNFHSGIDNPIARAQAYLAKALALNPNSQQAHLTLGWISILSREKDTAVSALLKADAINPNSSYSKVYCGVGLTYLGEYEKADALMEQAIPLHPLPYWWFNLPHIFRFLKSGDFDKMLFYARKIGTPAGIHKHVFEMIALFYLQEFETLKKVLAAYLEKHPTGIDHAINTWSKILYDDDLVKKITFALEDLK